MATTQKRKTAEQVAEENGYEFMRTKFEAYNGNEPYLFVSYSHRDTMQVYPILDLLHDCKYRIWYDESCEVGNDFRDELRRRIQNSEGILLFVSEASMNSPFCGMEIITAKENGKKLFPIFLEDNTVVPPAFEILLANTHHSDTKDMNKLIDNMKRDLPPAAMDRLTIVENKLHKCEDNGEFIEVDEGVTTICAGAFKGRRALKHIQLPESLEEIEGESFRGCGNLQSMDIPMKTLRIGESAFRDCVSMTKLVIQNKCIKIGERAFENCAALSDLILPDGLTEIYGGVFNSCKSLKHVNLPSSLTILGESAFSDCVGLEKMDIPQAVTKIDDLVFNGCTSMTSIELHEGLRKIGKGAFKNCKSLTNVVIPASVTHMHESLFRGCESMKSIRVEPKNKHYKSEPNKREGNDHVLFNKNKSMLIAYPASSREVQYDIPDSVIALCDWAFCDCKKLNRITIPDSVHTIGEGTFSNCILLDEVEIPDSVTKIDDCAFRGCTSLEKVLIPSSVEDIGWGVFDGCETIVTVYCDEGSAAQRYCQRNGIREARVEDAAND